MIYFLSPSVLLSLKEFSKKEKFGVSVLYILLIIGQAVNRDLPVVLMSQELMPDYLRVTVRKATFSGCLHAFQPVDL